VGDAGTVWPAPSVAAVRVVITVTMTVTNQRIFDRIPLALEDDESVSRGHPVGARPVGASIGQTADAIDLDGYDGRAVKMPRCACSSSTLHEGRPRAGGRHAVTLTLD